MGQKDWSRASDGRILTAYRIWDVDPATGAPHSWKLFSTSLESALDSFAGIMEKRAQLPDGWTASSIWVQDLNGTMIPVRVGVSWTPKAFWELPNSPGRHTTPNV